ncbi:MAG: ATP-dependent Clp protease ATP-binding subunit ClpA [Acidobacteria bacterium]|nr:ATP-dependent Clp protease ATP-binding subunit ClpA [Acidobacteriota bacterium]
MLTKELQLSFNRAVDEAINRRHEYISLEHLLYALLHEKTATNVIRNCGGQVEELKRELEKYLNENYEALKGSEEFLPEQTAAFQRVVQRAVMHAQASGAKQVNSGDILASIFLETNSNARYLLEKQGITRLDVLNFVSHGVSKLSPKPEGNPEDEDEDLDPVHDPLAAFTVNLIERAAQGGIDPLIGRLKEVERTIQILCRRRKNNPIYVGDPGVGKTAIAEGLALKIQLNQVPEVLRGAEVFALDLGSMLSGTKYRGEFEQRLKAVINELKKKQGAILFIDEIHTIVGAGAVSGGSMDASNILKPALATGELRCIGSTTFPEYKASFERDRALARRFQKIEVSETTVPDTIKILEGLKKYYEAHHGVRYSKEALVTAAELSAKYINDRFLPDKAIDVIDEAGAAIKLLPKRSRPKTLTPEDIELVVARMAKIPPKTVSVSDKDRLKNLEDDLKTVIYGQDHAIEQIVKAIKISRSGLGHPHKPIGSFLFSGPTGVGKTELTKQLAQSLGIEFLRFDMSEYMEKHTVSRLIGAPPGYVGFDQGGLLTDAVNRTPYCVLVLDEIEKAHPDVFNILLQVMDHATLTDNNGKKADFRNVIFIMTTNAGGREISSDSIGFNKGATGSKGKGVIERTFSPEFRNRLDGWVAFNSLASDAIKMVVDKFINEVREQVAEKSVTIELTDAARNWLAEKGYDKQMGARPMGRLIQAKIKEPLAEEILFGNLQAGGKVLIDAKDGEIALEFAAN